MNDTARTVLKAHIRTSGCHSPNTTFDATPVPFSAKRLNQYGYTIMTVANSTHIHLEQISIDDDEAVVDTFWLSKDAGHVSTEEMRRLKPGKDFPHVAEQPDTEAEEVLA